MAKTIKATSPKDDSDRLIRVNEVMDILQVSRSKAYKEMERVNKELQAQGKFTIAGRVSKKHLMEYYF